MSKQWMAVYTKPRNEKKVIERLSLMGVECYCPMQTRLKQWSDRVKKVTEPLISSYVFVKVSEKDREMVLQDIAVRNFVFWLGKPAIIRNEEIERLKYINKDGELVESINLKEFNRGDKVRLIKSGFENTSGVLQKVGRQKVSVLLESIGLIVEISKMNVEKA